MARWSSGPVVDKRSRAPRQRGRCIPWRPEGRPAARFCRCSNLDRLLYRRERGLRTTANGGPLSPSGGFGGGQIGYNWQGLFGYSPWVLGVEADFQGSGISDSIGYGGDYLQTSLNWFGTVRGRVGYSFGPALLYGRAASPTGKWKRRRGPIRSQ